MEPKKIDPNAYRACPPAFERSKTGEMEPLAQQLLRKRTGIGWKVHNGPAYNERLQVIDYLMAKTDQIAAKMNLEDISGAAKKKNKANRVYIPALREGEYLLNPKLALSALHKLIGDELLWAKVSQHNADGSTADILMPAVTEDAIYASMDRNIHAGPEKAFRTNMTRNLAR